MKEHSISIVSGLAGVIIGALLQFAITYQLVEKPKIAIEEKKTAIEVQRIISNLSTNVDTKCTSEKNDTWTWHINCFLTNKGTFPVKLKIEEVSLYLVSDHKRLPLKKGENFSFIFPKDDYNPTLNPGAGGYMDYYLTFKREKYPDGIQEVPTGVNTLFEFETSLAAQKFLSDNFPDATDFISEYSKARLNFMTLLID